MRPCLLLSCLLVSVSAAGDENAAVSPTFDSASARQFDFWTGAWRVNLRTRQDDLAWQDSVIADARVWQILDGRAVLELWDSEPIKGFSLRWFDPAADEWKLWLNWPSPDRSAGSGLAGRFRHGRGEFFSTSTTADGEELLTRYTFSDIAPDRLRWDDGYSTDGGRTWSSNWIMEFTRVAQAALPPDATLNAHTYSDGSRCTLPEFAVLNDLAGRYAGRVDDVAFDGQQSGSSAALSVHRILDGCAVMAFLHAPGAGTASREFRLLTFNTVAGRYEESQLDNDPGAALRVRYGSGDEQGLDLQNTDAGHRATWRIGSDGTLTISDYRVPTDGGALARRRVSLAREGDNP